MRRPRRGRAVQIDPIKPKFKAPGTKRSKLKSDELLSNFAFKTNLRRYDVVHVSGNVYHSGVVGRCRLTI